MDTEQEILRNVRIKMLPARGDSCLYSYEPTVAGNILVHADNRCKHFKYTAQHLYFVSDEIIHSGDIVTDSVDICKIFILPNLEAYHIQDAYGVVLERRDMSLIKGLAKIVVSTDPYLNLPMPSKEVIYSYIHQRNQGNTIKDVDVVYEKHIRPFHQITPTIKPLIEYKIKTCRGNILVNGIDVLIDVEPITDHTDVLIDDIDNEPITDHIHTKFDAEKFTYYGNETEYFNKSQAKKLIEELTKFVNQ